jgi:hypothetical protein
MAAAKEDEFGGGAMASNATSPALPHGHAGGARRRTSQPELRGVAKT